MIIYRFAELIATFFYIGYTPKAPGTVCSFVTLVLCWFLPSLTISGQLLVLIILFFLGVWASTVVERLSQRIDPSCVVIDEVVGMMVAVFMLPKNSWYYLMAFLIFRFFDISKLFPVYLAERYLKRGWAIMIDDILAGLMAILLIRVILVSFFA